MTIERREKQYNWCVLLDELKEKEALTTDTKLAASLDVTRGFISAVRNGRKNVSLHLASIIFARLGRPFILDEVENLLLPLKIKDKTRIRHDTRRYVIARAKGRCELCNSQAPFVDNDGRPYLDMFFVSSPKDMANQIEYLKPIQQEIPSNVVALCPNCNQKMRIAPNRADREKLIALIEAHKREGAF